MRPNAWTQAEKEWLREHYPHHYNRELVEMHAEAFPDRPRRTVKAINTRGRVYGLLKAPDFVKHPRRFWTEDKQAWFVAFVPGHEESEISAEHERLYGTPLSEAQIANAKVAFNVKSGTKGGCFKKGHEPHNKGKTWDEIGLSKESKERSLSTCFKKGEVYDRPDGWIKPIGYERISKDGYVEVKVKDSSIDGIQPKEPGNFNRNYRKKHHVVYEQHYGEIPEGCNIVFADGDKRNFDPDNLVAVPRKLWATIRNMGYPYCDAKSLKSCMTVAALVQATAGVKRAVKEEGRHAV